MKIYSKINDTLIASYINANEINSYRNDLSPDSEYLQVSARDLSSGTFVKSHRHKIIKRQSDITQESWIIITGKIVADIYDIDNSFMESITIDDGGCITLYRGGHSLLASKNSIFYEIKLGPYYGNDKEDIC